MGDRCFVTLETRATDARRAAEILIECGLYEQYELDEWEEATDTLPDRGFWEFEECNYGDLDGAEPMLVEAGIAFDKTWGAGGDYESGFWAFRPATAEAPGYNAEYGESAFEMLKEIKEDLEKNVAAGTFADWLAELKAKVEIPPLEEAA